MNIIEDVGVNYFQSRFAGAMFLNSKEVPCIIDTASGNRAVGSKNVPVVEIIGTPEKYTTKNSIVPKEFFSDMYVFSTPPMGYRTAAGGRFAGFFRRNNRSYQRGTNVKGLDISLEGFTEYLFDTNDLSRSYHCSQNFIASILFSNNYIPISEGIPLMNEGKILSFAINEKFLVRPQTLTEEDNYELVFKGVPVGTIEQNGTIAVVTNVNPKFLEDL